MLRSRDTIAQYLLYFVIDSIIQIVHMHYNLSFCCLISATALFSLISTAFAYVLGIFTVLLFLFTRIVSGRSVQDDRKSKHFGKSSLFKQPNGNICILYLKEDTPYENGKSHGMILRDDILKMVRWYSWIWKKDVETDHIPEEFLMEIKGIVDGVNHRLRPRNQISTEDILRIYYVADVYSACTCIGALVDKKWVFGRNMDWIPFQMAHKSIIIRYKNGLELLTAPGVIGLITGWKGQMRMAMNVCPDPIVYTPSMMPTVLYNRHLIENCTTVEQIRQHLKEIRPRNAYHLSVLDGVSFESIAVYQNADETDLIRNKSPVFVVNDSKNGNSAFLSRRRLNKLNNLKFASVRHVLEGLKACKSFETVHTVIFVDDKIWIGVDNGYSTDALYWYVPLVQN